MTGPFTGKVGGEVYPGFTPVTVEAEGFTLKLTVEDDDTGRKPWQDDDGAGIVTGWIDPAKAPKGAVQINHDRDGTCRFYDVLASREKAKREGWVNSLGLTALQLERRINKLVMNDCARMKAWCEDDWSYIGLVINASREGVQLTGEYEIALWGIESDAGDYLEEVANDLAGQAISAAKAKLTQLVASAG